VPTTAAQQAVLLQSVQAANANRPGTGAPGAGGGSPMNEVVAQLEMLNNKALGKFADGGGLQNTFEIHIYIMIHL
jgi:hypothetical protein